MTSDGERVQREHQTLANANVDSSESAGRMASLEVHREFGGVTDHLRAYKVVVDGAVIGRLHPGRAETFEMAPGSHELVIKIDWARSERLAMELAPGEVARFRCGTRANMLTNIYWATIGWRRYLWLMRESEEISSPAIGR